MRALLAPYDKTGLIDFAKGLVGLGWELIATGNTERQLREAGLPVISVAEVIGFPEILDGRVKTLHPAIHGPLLARRDDAEHMKTLAEHGMTGIDLVANNLYPFEQTVAKPGVSMQEALENIDIGGPAMLRAAAKNYGSRGRAVRPVRLRRDAGVAAGRGRRRRHAAAAGGEGVPARGRVRHAGRALPQGRRGPVPGRALGGHAAPLGPALRREPAPEGGVVRGAGAAGRHRAREAAARRADFVQQRARRRRGLAHGQRLRRTDDRDHQAHQPLRPGVGRQPGRRVPAGADGRPDIGVRRHRRVQPADRRRAGTGDAGQRQPEQRATHALRDHRGAGVQRRGDGVVEPIPQLPHPRGAVWATPCHTTCAASPGATCCRSRTASRTSRCSSRSQASASRPRQSWRTWRLPGASAST